MSGEVHKIVIAIEYLDTAATLWLFELNHFSAMHLAGAAEEIAGKACRIAGKAAHFDDLRSRVVKALTALRIDYSEQEIKEAAYGAKNAVKHMDSRNDAMVSVDARKAAADYIFAAYRNFEKLGLQSALSESVRQVVDANTIKIEIDA